MTMVMIAVVGVTALLGMAIVIYCVRRQKKKTMTPTVSATKLGQVELTDDFRTVHATFSGGPTIEIQQEIDLLRDVARRRAGAVRCHWRCKASVRAETPRAGVAGSLGLVGERRAAGQRTGAAGRHLCAITFKP